MRYHLLNKALFVLCIIWVIAIPISAETIEYFDGETADGYLEKTDIDYATAWGRISGDADADAMDTDEDYNYVGQVYDGSSWKVRKSYFYFDTSSIPHTAKVYGAWFDFYVDGAPTDPTYLTARQAATSPQLPLTLSNFDYYDYTAETPDTVLVSSTGDKQLILYDNEEGLDIDTDGITKFAIVVDNANSGDTDHGWVKISSAESSNKPQIRLEYNSPPNTPAAPIAEDQHHKNSNFPITFSTTDPDGDDIQYKIDWGDGTVTNWIGPYASGTEVSKSHQYSSEDNYEIKVKARDMAQVVENGRVVYCDNRENPTWSSAKSITITKMATVEAPDPGDFVPEDPDQGINRVTAEFRDGEAEETNALYIWWNLTEAARIDPDLKMTVAVENINGIHVLGTSYAWKHMMPESAFVIEDWNGRFADGAGRWNFVLKTRLENPTEPTDADQNNNQYDLRFILGFPLSIDHLIWVAIVGGSIVAVAFIIYFRKAIFYRFYTPYERIPDAEDLSGKRMSSKLRDSLMNLKIRKAKYGDTGIPGVEAAKGVGEKGVNKLRGVKAKMLTDLEDVGDRWDKFYPSRPGPRSPLRLEEIGKSKERQKELREKAKAEEEAAREAAIGTGLVERLFYPSKRRKRIAKEIEKEEKQKKAEEREKRRKWGKKGAKAKKKKREQELKEWGSIRPARVSIKTAEKLSENKLSSHYDDLNEYIGKMSENLGATSSKQKVAEIQKRIDQAQEEKEIIKNTLANKEYLRKLDEEAETLGKKRKLSENKKYTQLPSYKKTAPITNEDVHEFNRLKDHLEKRANSKKKHYGVKELFQKIPGGSDELHMWTDEELEEKQPTTVTANLVRLNATSKWAKRRLKNLKKPRKTKKNAGTIKQQKKEYRQKKMLYLNIIDQTEKARTKQWDYVNKLSETGAYDYGKNIETSDLSPQKVKEYADKYVTAIMRKRADQEYVKAHTGGKYKEAAIDMAEWQESGGDRRKDEKKYSRYLRSPCISTGFRTPSMKKKKFMLWHKRSAKKNNKKKRNTKKTKTQKKKYYYRTIKTKNGKKKRVKCKMPTTRKKKTKKTKQKKDNPSFKITWW